MNTNDTITGAQLQTLPEAAGLSRDALAELAQVQARTVKHWETRTGAAVPADVAAIVTRLSGWVLHTAREGLRQVQQAHHKPAEVVLLRYRESAHLHPQDVAQGLHDVHGAMVARLVLDLAANGHRARVVWFDPEEFAHWVTHVQGLPPGHDTPDARATWAAQAIERQAIPHPGDQPPPGHNPGS